jgi:PAS domain S-box-containing protein
MGLSREELCGWGWRELIHLDDVPQAQAAWDQAVRSGKPYSTDHRIRRIDGLYYWVAARGQPVTTEDGQVQKWVGTFVEIQGQRYATEDPILHVDTVAFQNNLQEDNTGQEPAIQTPDMGLFDYDLMTGEVNFSPGYKRQLGYQDEEFANNLREMDVRLHPEDRERVTQSWHSYLADPRPFYQFQYRVRHKDGDYRWMLVRVELIRDASGRPCRVLGCQLDLTERNHAEEDRARLAAIVQSSEDAIVGKTLSGLVTSWNEGGPTLARLYCRGNGWPTLIAVDVSVSISPIRDASGRIVGASKIARDAGARKRAQAAVEQANEQLRENAMVLELAPVLVRDMDNRIVLWTRGAERLYGFSKDEALDFQGSLNQRSRSRTGHERLGSFGRGTGRNCAGSRRQRRNFATQLAERRSLGLLGMREQAGVFGGVVEIVGSQGRGTSVIVQIPLLKTDDENLDR